MGKEGNESTNRKINNHSIWHSRLIFPMDVREVLIKNNISLVYFTLTARILFAAMVSYHSNYQNCRVLHCNDLIIHFALTARDLFASKVAHHDHHIYDWNHGRIWQKKKDCLCGNIVCWNLDMIEIREVLTQDDGEFYCLVKSKMLYLLVNWKLSIFHIKEILTHNHIEVFRIRMWVYDPHTRNDGECYTLMFVRRIHCYVRINKKQWINDVCMGINK
jgi:hypothetical protein